LAREAGYSESVARKATLIIETAPVMARALAKWWAAWEADFE